MNQVAGNQMRLYDLPSKLLCRVINVELKVPAYPLPLFARFSCSIPLRLRKIVFYLFVCWEIRFGQLICLWDFARRRRTPTRSTRKSCSCRSRR